MTAPPPAMPLRAAERVPALDGVRGIAIVLVLLMHGMFFGMPIKGGPNPLGTTYMQYATLGWCGVDVFFVLSGFLITGILLQSRGSSHYFRDFYARRSLRIFPLYYTVIVLLLWVLPRPPADAVQQWSYLLYYQNLLMGTGYAEHDIARGVTWSLAIEEQFYLVWPAVVWFAGRRALVWVCLVVIAAALVTRFVLVGQGQELFGFDAKDVYYLTPCRLDTLAVGALLAVVPLPPQALGWACLLGGAGWLVGLSHRSGHSMPHAPEFQTFGLVAALLLAVGVLIVARHPGWFARAITNRVLMSIGRYSYCIYLTHFLVIEQVFWWLFGDAAAPVAPWQRWVTEHVPGTMILIAVTALYLGCTWLVGFVSYWAFEQWFLRLKRFFPGR